MEVLLANPPPCEFFWKLTPIPPQGWGSANMTYVLICIFPSIPGKNIFFCILTLPMTPILWEWKLANMTFLFRYGHGGFTKHPVYRAFKIKISPRCFSRPPIGTSKSTPHICRKRPKCAYVCIKSLCIRVL